MSSIDRLRTSLALLVFVITACMISPQRVIAQEWPPRDPVEAMRRLPPGRQMISPEYFKAGAQMLEWQIQRGEMTQRHLKREIDQLRAEIQHKEVAVRDVVTENTPAQFRFATEAVREQLVGQVLQKLLDSELEIAAHEAVIETLDAQPEREQEQMQFKLRDGIFEARLQALQQEHALFRKKLEYREELAEKGAFPQSQIDEARLPVAKLEGELRVLELERQLNKVEHDSSADVPQRLADVRLETHRLKALMAAAERQLEELTKAAESARKSQSLQREIDQLNERLLLRVKRLEEVEMETEEAQLLLKQVEETTKENAEPAETEDAESTPDR